MSRYGWYKDEDGEWGFWWESEAWDSNVWEYKNVYVFPYNRVEDLWGLE